MPEVIWQTEYLDKEVVQRYEDGNMTANDVMKLSDCEPASAQVLLQESGRKKNDVPTKVCGFRSCT
jgi:hypothetical protein